MLGFYINKVDEYNIDYDNIFHTDVLNLML